MISIISLLCYKVLLYNMKPTLWIKTSSGTVDIPELGITIDTTERELTAEFRYDRLSDSEDLYNVIGTAGLQFSKLGGGSWVTLADADVIAILETFTTENHRELINTNPHNVATSNQRWRMWYAG